jgi:hypothetical protein
VTWATDSGDPVESRNLPAAPPEVGDDPAGSDGSTATPTPAVGTGESATSALAGCCTYCGEPLADHTPEELHSCDQDIMRQQHEAEALSWLRSQA